MSKIKLLREVAADLKNLAESIQSLVEAMDDGYENTTLSDAQSKTKETPIENEITLEQVRTVLAEKSYDGFTKEVRKLIEKYGAKRLSEINSDNYASLLADAEGLK